MATRATTWFGLVRNYGYRCVAALQVVTPSEQLDRESANGKLLCLPLSVDVAFDGGMVASLRAGNRLNMIATANGGWQPIFSISLTGFSGAHDGVATLTV